MPENRTPTRQMNQDPFMEAAIEEARKGLAEGGIPIGSVLVHKGVETSVLNNAECIELMTHFIEKNKKMFFKNIGTTT